MDKLTSLNTLYILLPLTGIVTGWLITALFMGRKIRHLDHALKTATTDAQSLKLENQTLQWNLQSDRDSLETHRQQLAEQIAIAREQLEEKHTAQTVAENTEIKLKASEKQLDSAHKTCLELREKYDKSLQAYAELKASHASLQTTLGERDKNHREQLEGFNEQKRALSDQFRLLANEILEAKTRTLQDNSKASLNRIIQPFQQSMENFKKEVQDIHHRETVQQSELRNELKTLKELNHQITKEAHDLSTALRGQKKIQGNWGELILENVLDRSGLILDQDYRREVSFTTEEGKKRPDAIVYLPEDKHLIIDAKVSLSAYTRFVNSEEENDRKQALKEHITAMKSRILELADKNYHELQNLNSPDMVFLFIPIESAFVEAIKADESIFQQAIDSNILLATPTTLLTSLQIVRQIWRYENQNKHTAALAGKADSLFKKLSSFLSSFENVKKSLDKALEAYGKAEGQLVNGRGNLVKQVSDFKELAPAIKSELPAYFTEKAELELNLPSQANEK